MFPPLSVLYKVLNWHANSRDKSPGESVGLFSTIPEEIACQFPKDGRKGHDESPSHITICYIGNVPVELESKIVKICEEVCLQIKPFTVCLGKPKIFTNHKNEAVLHSPVKSKKLHVLHESIKRSLKLNQIQVDSKFPEYKPHVTIEYAESKKLLKYKDLCPTGEWVVDSMWLWGTKNPYLIHLGKKR